MRSIFLLSKEDLKLAKEEALSLFGKKGKLIENLLFLDVNNIKLADRLAYTRKVYQFLFETNNKELIKKIKEFNWQSVYKNNFCVRIHDIVTNSLEVGGGELNLRSPRAKRAGLKKCESISQSKFMASNRWVGLSEKTLAGYIWNKIKNPKVNLKTPKTSIEFFITKNRIYATKLVKELKHDFESRKAHKRPELHPTALNPKLARALINLAGAEKDIMDPFCGAGGILIEAGLIKLKPIGYDLYRIMLKKAKVNLDYYKIKNYKLINQDALKIKKKYNYIVTDIPYGLNTSIWIKKGNKNKKIPLKQTNEKQKIKNLEDFYLKFLKNLKKIMGKKAVVIFPHYVDYKKLIKKAGFNIDKEFSQFIHRSLTRKIVVLS